MVVSVSTNDIITSEFFNKTKASVGIMSVNYRNINPKYNFLAGNYTDFIFYKIKSNIELKYQYTTQIKIPFIIIYMEFLISFLKRTNSL